MLINPRLSSASALPKTGWVGGIFKLLLVVFAISSPGFVSVAYSQQNASEQKTKLSGERLLRRHCGRCHAVGSNGQSPHPSAPMFKNISKKYPVEFLSESLVEGIMIGHPDMPVFYFQEYEVAQIIAYLESIQDR